MLIDHLTSAAKVKIFKLLVRVRSPLCFREIVDLANVGIRSAQIALRDFKRIKLLTVRNSGNRITYQLLQSPETVALKKMIDAEINRLIQVRAKRYSKKTRLILPLIQELNDFGALVKARVERNAK